MLQNPSKSLDVQIKRINAEILNIQKEVQNAPALIAQIAKRLDFSNMFNMCRLNHIDYYSMRADMLLANAFRLRAANDASRQDEVVVEITFDMLGCDNVQVGGMLKTPREQAVKLLAMKHLYENDAKFKNKYWQFMMDQCPTTEIGGRFFDFVIDNSRLRTASQILAIPMGYDTTKRTPENSKIIRSLWQDQYDRMQQECKEEAGYSQTITPDALPSLIRIFTRNDKGRGR